MTNTVPHPAPRHRSVRHPTARAIVPARVPRASGERVPVKQGTRGQPRTGHGLVTGRQDGVGGPALERTYIRGSRDGRASRSGSSAETHTETPRRRSAPRPRRDR